MTAVPPLDCPPDGAAPDPADGHHHAALRALGRARDALRLGLVATASRCLGDAETHLRALASGAEPAAGGGDAV